MTLVRGISGIVAGGVVVLVCVVIGAAVMGARRDFPGPGAESLTWHVLAALVVVAAQIMADRRHGFAALSGSAIVLVTTGVLLWTQWWG
ncbi:hypothetical protein [Nocardia mangyaensis]|uniref:hypothetical protein n=1 Tax=Nocardia mangyaensis TaxID=2213200 RepID=UPI0026743D9C|nr:hypothetical protein [Nocardia mangyaensis]MDO3645363.1 hypothetical protein [Nocardia mangyaensis]